MTARIASRTAILLAAAALLAAQPFSLDAGGKPHLSSAFAKDGGSGGGGGNGGGHGGGGNGGSGSGGGGGHGSSGGGSSGGGSSGGGSSGGDSNGGGSSGGGHSGGNGSGGSGSHDSGRGGNEAGDDHGGGRRGADDGAGDDRRADDGQRGLDHVSSVTGAKVEVDGRNIEVTTRDGFREEIANGRYELKDPRGRTVVERAATAMDRARLSGFAR